MILILKNLIYSRERERKAGPSKGTRTSERCVGVTACGRVTGGLDTDIMYGPMPVIHTHTHTHLKDF